MQPEAAHRARNEVAGAKTTSVAAVTGLWKSYGGVPVLSDVHIDIAAGEIHALVGGNGAGKSTLMKIITGVVTPDAGEIVIGGTPIRHLSLRQAHANRVYMVPQEPQLFGHLSVFENIALTLERGVSRSEVGEALRRLSAAMSLDTPASELSISDQQLVEIARGMLRNARLLIVDEPTAALTAREADLLFAQLRALALEGVGIFFVSHRLSEVFALCDRVSVLRDGKVVLQGSTKDLSRAELVLAIAPDMHAPADKKRAAAAGADPCLEVEALTGQGFCDVSFSLYPGQVLGIAGVVGSGRSELADTIYGLRPGTGTVKLLGAAYDRRSAHASVARGLAYVPEDRHADGVFLSATIEENVTSTILNKLSVAGLVHFGKEHNVAQAFARSLALQPGPLTRTVASLSGGNQQKVSLAKALACDPRVIILDEPSRGVDVGARADLYRLIDALAGRGLAVLLISSDFEEIVELSSRVLVMRDGRVHCELAGADITFAAVRDKAFATSEVTA